MSLNEDNHQKITWLNEEFEMLKIAVNASERDKIEHQVYDMLYLLFEIEELYVSKQYRSLGIGGLLYDTVLKELLNEDVIYVTLVAANRNSKQLLDFYTSKDMNVANTRLFRQINDN